MQVIHTYNPDPERSRSWWWYHSLTAHQHQKVIQCQNRCKLPYKSKQNAIAIVKWVQSPVKVVKWSRRGTYWANVGEWVQIPTMGRSVWYNHVTLQKVITHHTNSSHEAKRKSQQNSSWFFFTILLSFSLAWDHMGVTITDDISSKSTHQIHCQKVMHITTEGIYQNCSKNCSNFGFCYFFLFR